MVALTHTRSDRSSLRKHLLLCGFLVVCTVIVAAFPAAPRHLPFQCVLHSFLGINCPFCGMTRDFTAMLHGHRPTLNPGSVPMAVLIYFVYPASLVYATYRERLHWFHHPYLHRSAFVLVLLLWVLNNQHH